MVRLIPFSRFTPRPCRLRRAFDRVGPVRAFALQDRNHGLAIDHFDSGHEIVVRIRRVEIGHVSLPHRPPVRRRRPSELGATPPPGDFLRADAHDLALPGDVVSGDGYGSFGDRAGS